VILLGLGGIFAEVIGDRELGLPPLNRTLARILIERTKAFTLLKGYRNRPSADLEKLELLLVCLSHLLVDFPEIAELDMNPVIIKDGNPCAVDARVRLERSDAPAPHHLVISPYPEQYESMEITTGNIETFIRPIKPEDADLLVQLFDALSSRSRYYRFFSPMESLSHDMLVQFTQIDYDRHIALVALSGDGKDERMLGVARLIADPDRKEAEVSVAVGDPWQGKGLGRKLLEKGLEVARDYGIRTVHGTVLAENTQMLNLARELGFNVSRGRDPSEYTIRASLG
jgi:acetyltransferase